LAGAAAAVLLLAACGNAGERAAPRPSSERLTARPAGSVEGAPLGYLEYLPPGYEDGEPRPLLVFLHGVGENGDGSARTLRRLVKLGIPMLIDKDRWPEERPFIVLAPQHEDAPNTTCPDSREVDSFLDFALDYYDVDQERVYLTGLSCGAIGAWDYLAVHTDERVAAAVLVAGDATSAAVTAGCKLGRVPVWAFHGARDRLVPVDRAVAPLEGLRSCTQPRPVDVRVTVYPRAGHDVSGRAYDASGDEISSWLLSHHR
jgi:predicted peptidase